VNPADFWKPWEETADSFAEVVSFIDRVRDPWVEGKGMSFAWRGVVHANWARGDALRAHHPLSRRRNRRSKLYRSA
jgi:hypothetical protein